MRHDLLRATTSSTLALLGRAMGIHLVPATPAGARAARGQTAAARMPRRAERDGGSRTERQLEVLGVGQPPDRAETGIPGVRW